jgi:hypothetical protein
MARLGRIEGIWGKSWRLSTTSPRFLGDSRRNRRIEREHLHLYLDGIVMKRTWAGEVRNLAPGRQCRQFEGFREILGIYVGANED